MRPESLLPANLTNNRLPMPCVGFGMRYAAKRPSGEGMESCAIAAVQTASSAMHHRLIGLTIIRRHFAVYFLPHRGQLGSKHCKMTRKVVTHEAARTLGVPQPFSLPPEGCPKTHSEVDGRL